MRSAAPFCLIRGRILPAAPHSRSFFEAGCIDFLKKVKLGGFLRKIRLPAPAFSPERDELCLERDSFSGNRQFKSNLKVIKRLCKCFVRLKPAERRSRFLKNERFFTFFKKSAKQRLQMRSQLPAALPGIDCSTAFSLIQPCSRSFLPGDFRFSQQKTQYLLFYAISYSFFSTQRACAVLILVDFHFLNHFLRTRGTFEATLQHFSRTSKALQGTSERFQGTPGR